MSWWASLNDEQGAALPVASHIYDTVMARISADKTERVYQKHPQFMR